MFTEKRLKRLAAAATAGLLGVILAGAMPDQIQKITERHRKQAAVTAWWRTIYPEFCFSGFPEGNQDKQEVKISFWLAQVLDW